jgi:hypothetical protein
MSTGEKILLNWDEFKKELDTISNVAWIEMSMSLVDLLKTIVVTDEQCIQIARFMYDAPGELRMVVWSSLQINARNLMKIHRHIALLMVCTATGKDTITLPRP